MWYDGISDLEIAVNTIKDPPSSRGIFALCGAVAIGADGSDKDEDQPDGGENESGL